MCYLKSLKYTCRYCYFERKQIIQTTTVTVLGQDGQLTIPDFQTNSMRILRLHISCTWYLACCSLAGRRPAELLCMSRPFSRASMISSMLSSVHQGNLRVPSTYNIIQNKTFVSNISREVFFGHFTSNSLKPHSLVYSNVACRVNNRLILACKVSEEAVCTASSRTCVHCPAKT